MIGVIHKIDETDVVEEFFQLFKTPWEPFQKGIDYDVILASAGCIPEGKARLLIIFGSELGAFDLQREIRGRAEARGLFLRHEHFDLPIYANAFVFAESNAGIPCLHSDQGTVGLRIDSSDGMTLRIGYDLFQEMRWLLSLGQPVENAAIPTLELHVSLLRKWILEAGIPFLEIPPIPAGKRFLVCLTHDIDFIGIRGHKFDHTMWGFLYRSTVGAFRDVFRRRISFATLFQILCAAASLPLIWFNWMKDFWSPFEWYLRVEDRLPATYFLIPFKDRVGEKVNLPHASRRATNYDVSDVVEWIKIIRERGCEVAVHGIDAWHSVEQGREELARIGSVNGASEMGNRTHWLLRQEKTARILEEAGYTYDSTDGYNETIGYRSGTVQLYRPIGARRLLELPLHIQDGAMFHRHRLDLSDEEASARCGQLIENAVVFGGVLTLLWHDRSHAPERLWGEFYRRLVGKLRTMDVWFATCSQAVDWYRKRREVKFVLKNADTGSNRVAIPPAANVISPPLILRIHRPSDGLISSDTRHGHSSRDVLWDGSAAIDVNELTGDRPT